MFKLDEIGKSGHDVAMPFGKDGEKPYHVAAEDVPLSHLIVRTRDGDFRSPAGEGVTAARRLQQASRSQSRISTASGRAELGALGVRNVRDAGPRSLRKEDAAGYPIQIYGLESNALNDK